MPSAAQGESVVNHFSNLTIELLPTTSLKPYARNPRTHSDKQIRQIAESIRAFGFTNPVLIDRDGGVIAGHGRIEAARQLGIEQIPTLRLADMTESQKRAYVIADNKLAENAGWDTELLAVEFQYLSEFDLEFDLTVTGFETGEIDVLLGEADQKPDKADEVPEADSTAVSRLGDLWVLGCHRLLCADATKPESFSRLLSAEKAQMVFTDPPYNVPIDGHVCGLGGIKHREFAMASGEMSAQEFVAFLRTVFENLRGFSTDGSIHFVCMDWRHIFELLTAGRSTYAELKNLCIWAKSNGGMGSFYRSRHELVFVFKNGTAGHINNVELGRYGRNRTNVWEYPGISSMGSDRLDELAMHPTVKPVALVADAILDCSDRGGLILDCFARP
jgi:DNA modification methylase